MEKEFEVGEKWGLIKMRRVRVEVRGPGNWMARDKEIRER
jgi:hypothetical protein